MLIHDHLDHRAAERPDGLCATDGTTSLTWARMRERSEQVAGWLAAELEPGARFGLLSKNSVEMLCLIFGASRAGVVPVPLNWRLAPPEWDFVLTDAGVDLLVAEPEFTGLLDAGCPGPTRRVAIGPGSAGWAGYEDRLTGHTAPARAVEPADPLYQIYTSGTTGRPKGAVVSQGAAVAHLKQLGTAVPLEGGDALIVMPMFHAAALVQGLLFVSTGTTTHIAREFDPGAVLGTLREQRIVITTLAPAMIQMLLEHPDVGRSDHPDLRYVLYGSAPIASEVLRRAITAFGNVFVQAYGMTETTTSATMLTAADHLDALERRPERLLSCGRPLPDTIVRVVDTDDRDLPPGTPGEIVVAGPQIMTGYWRRPEATDEALRGGWMHTGDIGHLDEDGYLYISDRLKDMIVSGGENIYPREIEDVLFSLPGVADAAVIGIPDERWGETPLAFVVRRAGADLDAADVIGGCRERLARYKCPPRVEFVDELPRNATGKVLKFELRKPYWAGRQRAVG